MIAQTDLINAKLSQQNTVVTNFISLIRDPATVAACVNGDCPDRVAANWYVALARLALSDGDARNADEMLECGLQFALEDARYAYLRAIIALEEGKKDKATLFARRAAALERANKPPSATISNFLEPFQGGTRIWLESIRREDAIGKPPVTDDTETPPPKTPPNPAGGTKVTAVSSFGSDSGHQSEVNAATGGASPDADRLARAELFRKLLRQVHSGN